MPKPFHETDHVRDRRGRFVKRPSDADVGPGWPRPRAPYVTASDTRMLPVPWINGANPWWGRWLTFRDDAPRAHSGRLCAVCGEHMAGLVVLGRLSDRMTSGPGAHPRCMLLAVKTCPHFTGQRRGRPPAGDDDVVAYAYDGPGPGYRVRVRALGETADEDDVYVDANDVEGAAWELTLGALRELARWDPLGSRSDEGRSAV